MLAERRKTGEAREKSNPGADEKERKTAYLLAGQLYLSVEPSQVTTILGSCVAACIWDPAEGIGGLTHFLLPAGPDRGPTSPKFGRTAIATLLEGLVRLGARPERLLAKVFGGACVLEPMRERSRHLGLQNVEIAMRLLAERSIPILAQDVGGERGRKLIFHTDTGGSWIRLL